MRRRARAGAGAVHRARRCSCARRGPRCSSTSVAEPGEGRRHRAVVRRGSPRAIPHVMRPVGTGSVVALGLVHRPPRTASPAAKPLNPDSWPSRSGVKKLPDCRNRPSNVAGMPTVRVQHRQRAEAHPDADPHRARRAAGAARPVSDVRRSRGWPSTSRCDRPARAARPGAAAARRPRPCAATNWTKPPRSANSGPSCTTSSGAGSSWPRSAGDQTAPVTAASSSGAGTANSVVVALDRRARRARPATDVAGELDHRLVAERAGRAQRVGRIGDRRAVPVVVLDLEQVLHAVDRRARNPQRPLGALAGERDTAEPEFLLADVLLPGDGSGRRARRPRHARR